MSAYTERRTLAQDEVLKHVLAALAVEGRTEIIIPKELIEDEIFREIAIKIIYDPDADHHKVILLYNRRTVEEISIDRICQAMGMTREAYMKWRDKSLEIAKRLEPSTPSEEVVVNDYIIEPSDDPRTVEPLGLIPPTTK